MATVRIDRFGRVLIPKGVREQLGLKPGEALTLEVERGRLLLEPEEKPVLVRKGRALVFDVPGQEDIRAALEWSREARDAHILYGHDET